MRVVLTIVGKDKVGITAKVSNALAEMNINIININQNIMQGFFNMVLIADMAEANVPIAEARDKGDLSENAEYDAAREAQGLLEMRIAKMEDTIANARIIDESKVDKSKVQILSRVTLLNHNTGKEVIYTIVAEHEANLREGKLAIGTPIAKALLGHKKGDRVDVTVPAGTIHFEILDINI